MLQSVAPPSMITSPASGPPPNVAMVSRPRGDGEAAGLSCVQFVPSKIQVSPRAPGLKPPKRTASPASGPADSVASEELYRDGGEVPGSASLHVVPLKIHVSSSCPPPAPLPPNSTTSPVWEPDVRVAMGAEFLPGGEVAGLSSVHFVPLKIHVSSK